MAHGHGHAPKPNAALATVVANMTSVSGVLDINKSIFTQPATFVMVRNTLGARTYDYSIVFRIDQPTNPALEHLPSTFLINIPGQTPTRAPIADDMRIVEPVNWQDISMGAPYKTDAIFSATITYIPDNVMDSDPTVAAPCYVIELS